MYSFLCLFSFNYKCIYEFDFRYINFVLSINSTNQRFPHISFLYNRYWALFGTDICIGIASTASKNIIIQNIYYIILCIPYIDTFLSVHPVQINTLSARMYSDTGSFLFCAFVHSTTRYSLQPLSTTSCSKWQCLHFCIAGMWYAVHFYCIINLK